MAKIKNDSVMCCSDCAAYLANNDTSGMRYSYNIEEMAKRLADIKAGEKHLAAIGHICSGDAERDEEFSTRPCDCCGLRLAGYRHHFVILR